MSANVFTTASEEETIEIGVQLAAALQRPATVLLIGDLGAGKTTLAKGIIQGLGAATPDEVASPTYTLIHEYPGDVYHIDLYRLDTAEEVTGLGLDDLFGRDSVVLIEWGERFPQLMPAERLEIRITTDGERRTIQTNSSLPR